MEKGRKGGGERGDQEKGAGRSKVEAALGDSKSRRHKTWTKRSQSFSCPRRADRCRSHGGARRILAERAFGVHSCDLPRCTPAVIRRQIIHPRAQ